MAHTDVAVAGVGYSKHVSKRRDVNIAELVWEAVSACYENAGLKAKDVDAFVSGNMPAFEGVNLPEDGAAATGDTSTSRCSASPPAAPPAAR